MFLCFQETLIMVRNLQASGLAMFCALAMALPAVAATITLSPTAPTIGASDSYQTSANGASETPTVSNPNSYSGGGNFDAARYISHEFGAQGEMFTIPSPGKYELTAVTIKGLNTEATNLASGSQLDFRVNTISGTSITTIDSETGTLPVNSVSSPYTGYLTLTLATPLMVTSGHTYGFDFYFPNGQFLGLDGATTAHSSGVGFLGSYTSSTDGQGSALFVNNTPNAGGYNRYFDVSLTAIVPEPSSFVLFGGAGAALALVRLNRRATRR
jgi:hypothetical protein